MTTCPSGLLNVQVLGQMKWPNTASQVGAGLGFQSKSEDREDFSSGKGQNELSQRQRVVVAPVKIPRQGSWESLWRLL